MTDSKQTRVLIPYFPQSGPWECCTCSDDHPEADVPYTTASKDLVCEPCIRLQFEQALDFDARYPARWGPDELDPSHYKLILEPDFIARYVRKGQEIEEANKPGIPEGMVRGKDCQLCPGCQKPVQLRDGCNHIVCLCGTQFCFICGEEADHHSDHWMEGRCPRWNNVEFGQAMHDGADVAVGEEYDMMLHGDAHAIDALAAFWMRRDAERQVLGQAQRRDEQGRAFLRLREQILRRQD